MKTILWAYVALAYAAAGFAGTAPGDSSGGGDGSPTIPLSCEFILSTQEVYRAKVVDWAGELRLVAYKKEKAGWTNALAGIGSLPMRQSFEHFAGETIPDHFSPENQRIRLRYGGTFPPKGIPTTWSYIEFDASRRSSAGSYPAHLRLGQKDRELQGDGTCWADILRKYDPFAIREAHREVD